MTEAHLLCFALSGWQAVRRRRRKGPGGYISSFIAFLMWKACPKREWNLHSCLSR